MADFMKVISGLTHCIRESEHIYDNPCGCCPYYVSVGFNQFRCESQQMKKDALELLKEREAAEPKQVDLYGKDEWWGLVCVCPDCKAEWMSDKADTHFCPKCGRSVTWDDGHC